MSPGGQDLLALNVAVGRDGSPRRPLPPPFRISPRLGFAAPTHAGEYLALLQLAFVYKFHKSGLAFKNRFCF
jgi:hypothetical protein